MSKAHTLQPTTPVSDSKVVRLGAGTGSANNLDFSKDLGKLVKLVGDSRFDLCAAGDPIEAQITAIEPATSGGYTIGSINDEDRIFAMADGSEAAGTGSIAPG